MCLLTTNDIFFILEKHFIICKLNTKYICKLQVEDSGTSMEVQTGEENSPRKITF